MPAPCRTLHGGMLRPVRWLVVLAMLGCACRADAPAGPPVVRAFYFWRTTFALSAAETRALAELGVTRLYVRMFDVAWSEATHRAAPVGPLTVAAGARVPAGVEVVPVVFVRDEVLRHAAAGPLAGELWGEVQRRAAALGITPRELQIDCDWTDHTRDAYFALLRALRQAAQVPLSATIRLHQVKYRERTGVPPVDRGMLMFYNMGKLSADPDARAIFDAASAERYLARVGEYPLPLDLALPIWSWTVQLRDGAVVGLLQSTDPAELDGVDFLDRAGDGPYVATRTTFLHGALLREGDVLKTEVTGPDETRAAAALVAPHLRSDPRARTVTLFDLSERNLRRHDQRSLDRVFRAVH
jgi:hypothetical protein